MLKGLRVRKIVKLAPGIKLNLSKSGGSLSFGGKGFTVNLGRKGTRTTVGAPGTGISYSKIEKNTTPGRSKAIYWVWTAVLIAAALLAWGMR